MIKDYKIQFDPAVSVLTHDTGDAAQDNDHFVKINGLLRREQ